ncbi:MAG: hypothetical protein NTV34_01835, partial [Proteobacteria bacterium]|nr:hypothetical protein [Pseudomonadota bacterium]
ALGFTGSVFLAISAQATQIQRQIEAIELRGTNRLDAIALQSAIRLKIDDTLDDESMAELRARVLGLGLFRDVIFSLQKGQEKDKAKLIITVVDDEGVVGTSALGGEFGLLATDQKDVVSDTSPFRSYHLEIIARNLFGNRHRADLSMDVDVRGAMASGVAAYGLPRFTAEAVQFDAVVAVSDPQYRYFETNAFGLKAQSIWSRSLRVADIQYGAVWYANTHQRYRLESWPEVVAGPRVGFVHDTRFLGFIPSEGWKAGISLIPSLVHRNQSVTEAQLAATWIPVRHTAFSGEFQSTTVGSTGVSTRGALRLDVPITNSTSEGTKAVVFGALRQGYDHFGAAVLSGSDAIFGLRYHSTGFIGQIAFQVTRRSPFKDQKTRTNEATNEATNEKDLSK